MAKLPGLFQRGVVFWVRVMDRLVAMIPEAYASKAQLKTLQFRVKAWR